jgi:signal transduction histidine kinase
MKREQPLADIALSMETLPANRRIEMRESLIPLSWVYDLYRLGAIIGGSDHSQVQQEVLEQIVCGVGATSGSLALVDDEKQLMYVAASTGLPPDIVGQPLDLEEGVLAWVARAGEPLLLIGDVVDDPRFSKTAGTRSIPLGSAIVWPLKWRDKVTGILSVNRSESAPAFTQRHLEHGQTLLNLVAIAIENTRLQDEQQRQIAGLTKLNTELVAMHQRLDEARVQVMQSEQMAALGRLAAGVAHEINNPLAYVSSNVGTLRIYLEQVFAALGRSAAQCDGDGQDQDRRDSNRHEQPVPESLREDLQTMIAEVQAGVNRVKHIVRQLRLFSHSGQGEWQDADLPEILESAIKFAGPELSRAPTIGKQVVVERNYGATGTVHCVAAQLNQVFLNLIVNAVQAMGDEGKLRVSTGQEGAWVWAAIADNGVGIEQDNLERIFQPFYTNKPPGQGTGLGLSLSYSIVRKHQGRIEVASKRGEGSTFTVWLPASLQQI